MSQWLRLGRLGFLGAVLAGVMISGCRAAPPPEGAIPIVLVDEVDTQALAGSFVGPPLLEAEWDVAAPRLEIPGGLPRDARVVVLHEIRALDRTLAQRAYVLRGESEGAELGRSLVLPGVTPEGGRVPNLVVNAARLAPGRLRLVEAEGGTLSMALGDESVTLAPGEVWGLGFIAGEAEPVRDSPQWEERIRAALERDLAVTVLRVEFLGRWERKAFIERKR